jgi:eukaryotic-like serine/threonine-protein kinase
VVAAPRILPAGTPIGPYEIVTLLGAGGMGVVYRARDPRLGRDVAVKVLPDSVSEDPDRLRRFEQEARAASALNHPNVLSVYDVGTYAGTRYVVSELLEGETLGSRLAAGPLPLRKVLDYAVQVVRGLGAAHGKGIVHRDLKPENLFVTGDGRLKILDFGLAKLSASPSPAAETEAETLSTPPHTTPGTVLGTVGYISPEQLRGRPADHRSDIFAFGAILFEMLLGRRAFKGETAAETMSAILNHDPLEKVPADRVLPPALTRVLERCLEKNPEDRFQSARDLAFHLEAISGSSDAVAAPAKGTWTWPGTAAAFLALVGASALAWYTLRSRASSGPPRLEYTPLTSFADSVVAPTLSPDGRMLAFIRGDDTFSGRGEVYVKILPGGEPVQLTHDQTRKMGPLAFSPDGSRIAYAVDVRDTWVVPALGGEPSRLLTNASGLSWIESAGDARHVMFSKSMGTGLHMGVFTSTESRADERSIYVPADVNGMAHRSFRSPDGKSVLLVEMDLSGWLPCRVVPFDGSSPGRTVGPSPAQCTDAAWSPDGRWMYLSVNAGSGFHIWRQPFPDGGPESVTSGATEEQGLSFAADGRSLVTSVGESQSTIWAHDSTGDRQATSEGYAYLPSFSGDGKRLYYLQRSATSPHFVSGELWVTDLSTGRRERLLPDFLMEHYDVSQDGKRVVFVSVDRTGHSPLWIAPVDASAPPRRLATLDAVRALFHPKGGVVFVGGEKGAPFLYRVRDDGSGFEKAMAEPVAFIYSVSPSGDAMALWTGTGGGASRGQGSVAVYPTRGGAPTLLCAGCATAGGENRGVTPPLVNWSGDGKLLYLHDAHSRWTYAIPLPAGRLLPPLPAAGLASFEEAANFPGARRIPNERAFMGADPARYAYPRVSTHRNLYRISLP